MIDIVVSSVVLDVQRCLLIAHLVNMWILIQSIA